jgi:hypothetical protein
MLCARCDDVPMSRRLGQHRATDGRWARDILERPHNIALQLTRARSAQQMRAARHFVPQRALIIYGPSQLNAVLCAPQQP